MDKLVNLRENKKYFLLVLTRESDVHMMRRKVMYIFRLTLFCLKKT